MICHQFFFSFYHSLNENLKFFFSKIWFKFKGANPIMQTQPTNAIALTNEKSNKNNKIL
jgi:hypothetical protein